MLFYVCRLTEDGTWEGLRSAHTEEYAEQLLDHYCDEYPYSELDILTYDEFKGGWVK